MKSVYSKEKGGYVRINHFKPNIKMTKNGISGVMKLIIKKISEKIKYFDWMLFIPYIFLCATGIIMVYSASSINLSYVSTNSSQYMIKQVLYVFIGLVLLFLFSHISLKKFTNRIGLMVWWGILAVLLFVARFLMPAVNGAHGWISLGAFSIQPAEFCKVYLVLFCAYCFANWSKKEQQGIQVNKKKPYIFIALLLFLIIIEPDTGGLMINLAIVLIMFITCRNPEQSFCYRKLGLKISNLFIILASVVMCIIALQLPRLSFIQGLKKWYYGIDRFIAFYNPFKYIQGAGRQLVNSYYAISNGGFFGLGLGNSIEKRGYLPEPYTDFILSVIAEELGFIGTAVILLVLMFIILRIFLIGIRANNLYDRLICYGVGMFMFVQIIFNVGAVVGLLPITGVTLPFISYGGSSMFVLSMALGLVMGISANQKRHLEKDPIE
nr:FtsW/RodA/SpoVE family cell cycle protein [uncultured Ligilactobacillus sp.]